MQEKRDISFEQENDDDALLQCKLFHRRTFQYLQELQDMRHMLKTSSEISRHFRREKEGLLKILAHVEVCPIAPPTLSGKRYCADGGDCCERCWRMYADIFDSEEDGYDG